MQGRKRKSSATAAKGRSTTLSPRTKKQIASRHAHEPGGKRPAARMALVLGTDRNGGQRPAARALRAQKAHTNALEQYRKPEKRRGGKRQSVEQVAHKVAWAAVKKKYEKKGDTWLEKAD